MLLDPNSHSPKLSGLVTDRHQTAFREGASSGLAHSRTHPAHLTALITTSTSDQTHKAHRLQQQFFRVAVTTSYDLRHDIRVLSTWERDTIGQHFAWARQLLLSFSLFTKFSDL